MFIFIVLMFLLSGVSALAFIIGLINPNVVLWFMDEGRRNRQSVAIIYLMVFIITIVLAVLLTFNSGAKFVKENIDNGNIKVTREDDENGDEFESVLENGDVVEDSYGELRDNALSDNKLLTEDKFNEINMWAVGHGKPYDLDTIVELSDGLINVLVEFKDDSYSDELAEEELTELNHFIVGMYEGNNNLISEVKAIDRISETEFTELSSHIYMNTENEDIDMFLITE